MESGSIDDDGIGVDDDAIASLLAVRSTPPLL